MASRWAAFFFASAAESTRSLRCSAVAVRLAARLSAAAFFAAAAFFGLGLGLLLAARLGGVGLVETGGGALLGGLALPGGLLAAGGRGLAGLLAAGCGLLLEAGGRHELGGALDALGAALGDVGVAQHGAGELVGRADGPVQGHARAGGLGQLAGEAVVDGGEGEAGQLVGQGDEGA